MGGAAAVYDGGISKDVRDLGEGLIYGDCYSYPEEIGPKGHELGDNVQLLSPANEEPPCDDRSDSGAVT